MFLLTRAHGTSSRVFVLSMGPELPLQFIVFSIRMDLTVGRP